MNEYGNVFDLKIKLTTIEDFGGWDNAYNVYFNDGGIFDKIYQY